MNLSFSDYGSGKPILLIHAFPLSRKMWQTQVESLTEQGFRVILPDLRGFGNNQYYSDFTSLEDLALDIIAILDILKIKRAIIGGLSIGGYVTFHVFRFVPDKFAALVLCDTTSSADTIEKRESRYALIRTIEIQGSVALVEHMLPNLLSNNTKKNNPDLVAKLNKTFLEVNPNAAIAALRGMAERMDSTDLLSKIPFPTALIFGEFDKITNLENAKTMQKQISDSNLYKIENAGHFSNLEQPQRFNEVLLDFCRNVEF